MNGMRLTEPTGTPAPLETRIHDGTTRREPVSDRVSAKLVSMTQHAASSDHANAGGDGMTGYDVAAVRLTRRRSRKTQKKFETRSETSERSEVTSDEQTGQQRVLGEQRALRLQRGIAALRELDERQRKQEEDNVERANYDVARVSLGRKRRTTPIHSAADSPDVEYVGSDDGLPTALMTHGATLDFNTNEVHTEGANVAAVRMVSSTRIEERAVKPIQVAVAARNGEQGIFVPGRYTGAVMLAATLTTANDGRALIPAVNSSTRSVKLATKKELGKWIPITEDMTMLEVNGNLRRGHVCEWIETLGDTATPLEDESEVKIGVDDEEARGMMIKLLRVYRKLTKRCGECPPPTSVNVTHHIDTGDAKPILLRRRRQAHSEEEVIDNNVTKMLAAGVIEEGDRSWGFPVVLVKKKDGEIRFCVDYRALNSVTKRDVYPLPRIDETLETLGGALLFTTLDLKAGYWQILVAPEDKDKTAFTTKKGLYRFVRMPFGLTNAPSTFQSLMNNVLRGLTWVSCL
ncbi:hypothetical protein PHMEG_00034319, partial [Phytophthora megakarya]